MTYKRSPDFAVTGNVYDKMELQNILQPVIEEVAYTNGAKLSTLKNNYRDWFSWQMNRVIAQVIIYSGGRMGKETLIYDISWFYAKAIRKTGVIDIIFIFFLLHRFIPAAVVFVMRF